MKPIFQLMTITYLTHFMPLIFFDTSWKHQKITGFLMFSGGGGEVSYYLEGGFLLSGCLLCYRSSHQRCSIKKGVLKVLAKFTGKHQCQSFFFKKVAGLRSATLSKLALWILWNFWEQTFKEHLRWLFLKHLCQCF